MKYANIIAAAEAMPWAIEPTKGRAIAEFLARKANGEDIPAAEVQTAVREQKQATRRKLKGGIGIIPLYGVMVQRASYFDAVSGLTSSDLVGLWFDDMVADKSIEVIILDVDSPGGSVFGTPELAAKVAAASKQKKIIAVANSVAASAAYWIAAQASELVVTPGGQVGSIGVYRMHVDRSKAMEQSGERVTFVASTDQKVAGHEFAPLDALGRQEMERSVFGYYDQFVRAVARGRKVSADTVRERFGQGGMVLADEAVRLGMADRVATLGTVMGDFGLNVPRSLIDPWSDAYAESSHPDVDARRRRLDADEAAARAKDRQAIEIRKRRMLLG